METGEQRIRRLEIMKILEDFFKNRDKKGGKRSYTEQALYFQLEKYLRKEK